MHHAEKEETPAALRAGRKVTGLEIVRMEAEEEIVEEDPEADPEEAEEIVEEGTGEVADDAARPPGPGRGQGHPGLGLPGLGPPELGLPALGLPLLVTQAQSGPVIAQGARSSPWQFRSSVCCGEWLVLKLGCGGCQVFVGDHLLYTFVHFIHYSFDQHVYF